MEKDSKFHTSYGSHHIIMSFISTVFIGHLLLQHNPLCTADFIKNKQRPVEKYGN